MKHMWLKRSDRQVYENAGNVQTEEGDMNQQILFTGGDILQTIETNPQNNQSIRNEQSNEDESVGKNIMRLPTSPSELIGVRGGQSAQNFFKSNKEIFSSTKRFFNLPVSSIHPASAKLPETPLPYTASSTGKQSTIPNASQQAKRKSKKAISKLPEFSFWAVVQIRKMMERLKDRYAYANLKAIHYSLIDDPSVDNRKKDPTKDKRKKYGEEPSLVKSLFRACCKKLTCSHNLTRKRYFALFVALAERIPVFTPSNTFKLLWDFVKGLSLLVLFFCIPLHIAVSETIITIIGKAFMAISISIIFSDLLVNLNTGYFSKGQIVTNRHLIIQNYISNQLLSDIIALVPLVVVVADYENQTFAKSIFSLLFFVKVSDFSRVLKKIEDSFLLRPTTTNIVALLKLLFVILFVAHLSACVWIFEGRNTTESDSWYSNDKIDYATWDPLWLDWYIKAYYFCTVTMVTVGYGDIYPASNLERVLSVGTMLLACCMYAYIVNSIGNIFSDFFRHSKEVKDNFYAINNYMEKKNISSPLKLKIKEYLSYYWDEERDNLAEKEEKIITQLSESLKGELKIEANKIVLSDSPIFHQNFSKVLNEKICGIIQEHRCFPEQVVIKEHEEDDCNIYFIQKGKVEVFITKQSPGGIVSTKSCQVLEKGQYFGAYSFFTGLPRQQSVRSMEFSQFLVIKRKDFIETIRSFEDDYQKFCMIKDQLMFNAAEGTVDNACFTCNQTDHIFTQCPITHYAPKRRQIIKRYHFSSTHHRRTPIVRNQQKFQTLRELEDTIKDGIKYLELNESYLLDQDWLDSFEEEDDSEDDSQSSNSDDQNIKIESIANNLSQTSSKHYFPKSKLKKYGSNNKKSQVSSPERNRDTTPDSNKFLQEENTLMDLSKEQIKTAEMFPQESKNLLEDTQSLKENAIQFVKQVVSENQIILNEVNEYETVQLPRNNFFPSHPDIQVNKGGRQTSLNDNFNSGAGSAATTIHPSQKNFLHQQLISIQDIKEFIPKPNQSNAQIHQQQKEFLSKGLLKNIDEPNRNQYFEGIEIKETTSQPGDILSVIDQERSAPFAQLKESTESIEIIPFFTVKHLQSDQQINQNMDSSQEFSNLNEISLAQWNPLERESKKDRLGYNEPTDSKRNDFHLDIQSPCFAESYRNSQQKSNREGLIVEHDYQNIESVRGFLQKESDVFSARFESARVPIIQNLVSHHPATHNKNKTLNKNSNNNNDNNNLNNINNYSNNSNKNFNNDNSINNNSNNNNNNNNNFNNDNSNNNNIFFQNKVIESSNFPTLSRQDTGYLGGGDQKAERSSLARKPRLESRHLSLAVSTRGQGKQVQIEDPAPIRKQKKLSTLILDVPAITKMREKAHTPRAAPSRKSLLSPSDIAQLGNTTPTNFDNSQAADTDKISKRERFWKHIQKNGQKIGSGGLCSPLIERARVRLGERTPNDQNSGSHSRHTSRSNNQQDFVPETSIQAIIAHSNFSRPVSPNSRGLRRLGKISNNYPSSPQINALNRTDTRRQILHKDSSQAGFGINSNQLENFTTLNLNSKSVTFEQLKSMFSAIMNRFDENSRPPFSANSITQQQQQTNNLGQKLNRLSSMYPEPQGSALEIEVHHGGGFNLLGNSLGIARTHQHTPSSHHPAGYFFANEEQRLKHMSSIQGDHINANQDFTQHHIDVLLDICYNFNTYYPEHNISFVMNLINKDAMDKLKIMKKIKIKKTKANLLNTISEALHAGSHGDKFKRKLISAKFMRAGNPRLKLNPINIPSEDEGFSEKSPSSSFNSKQIHASSSHKVNFSSAIRRALQQNKITPGISQIGGNSHSSNSNNNILHHQLSSSNLKSAANLHLPSNTIFSKFKN